MGGPAVRLIDKLQIDNVNVFTGTGNVTMVNEGVVIVNKASGAATTVTLPASPEKGRFAFVKDGKGDAGTNNVTVQGAAGTIDGASTYVIAANYGGVLLCYNGTEWNVVPAPSGVSGTFNNLTVNGTETVTGNANLNGTKTVIAGSVVAFNSVANASAAGTVIGNAAALTALTNVVANANNSAGVQLPANPILGQEVAVVNTDATHTLKVYPDVNGTINGGSANAAVTLASAKAATYQCTATGPSQWWSLSN